MVSYPTLPTHIQCITSTDRLSPQYLIYSTKVNFLSHTTKLFHRKKHSLQPQQRIIRPTPSTIELVRKSKGCQCQDDKGSLLRIYYKTGYP